VQVGCYVVLMLMLVVLVNVEERWRFLNCPEIIFRCWVTFPPNFQRAEGQLPGGRLLDWLIDPGASDFGLSLRTRRKPFRVRTFFLLIVLINAYTSNKLCLTLFGWE